MLHASKGKYLAELVSDITRTESGLFLARTLKPIPHTAKVISVGMAEIRACANCEDNLKPWYCRKDKAICAKHNKPKKLLAKEGDIVHFKPKGGKVLNYQGKKYVVLTYNDILAKEVL